MQGEHPSYGALLCFGYHPSHQIVGAYTRCVYWSDTKRLSGWIDDRECRGSLLQQFTQACDFLRNHLHFSRVIDRGGSSERPEIPFRALEEAVANALVHREYVTEPARMVRTEVIQVEIFSDRVEITSPGGPPVPLNPKHPESHLRNSQIMRIFYLAGLVENLSTGIIRMQDLMQQAGLPNPDIRADEQAFTIILHRRVQSLDDSVAPISQPAHANSPDKNKKPLALPAPTTSPKFPRPLLVGLRTPLIIVAILALVVGVYFVNGRLSHFAMPTPPLGPASTTIEIASDFPTSGLDTISGLPVQNGVQMAITEVNNERLLPSYTLKLVPYDDVGAGNRLDPQVGVNNLKQAIANNLVAGVIGAANTMVALKELPLANQAPLALLSPSATFPCLTKSAADDPNCTGINDIATQMRPTSQLTFFRLATTDDRQGKAAADYFFQTKHYSKILLLKDDSDPYSSGLAQTFWNEWDYLGGQTISLNLPESVSRVPDYQNTLQTVASFQPDLIYFAGVDPNGSYVLQALFNIAALKMVPFAGGDGIMDSGLLQRAASLHRDAPIYVSLPIEDPAHSGTAMGRDFATNYTSNGYGYYRPYAATAYNCTMMLIQAIKVALQTKGMSTPHGTQDHAGTVQFRQAVLQALRHLSYTGATGTHKFDRNGDTTNHTVSFYQADLSTPQPGWTWLQQVHE